MAISGICVVPVVGTDGACARVHEVIGKERDGFFKITALL